MKGVVLAGGTGSRLAWLTSAVNKHLLPVGQYPMIFYPLAKLKEVGITDVLVVTSREAAGSMADLLGSGAELGMCLSYRVQDRPGGIADALALAEPFAQGHSMVVILGDNVFEDSLARYVQEFQEQSCEAKVFLKTVPDPERYGVPELNHGRIVGIEEKPHQPKSDFCVTGIYMYDPTVFDVIRTITPSGRGELEITDLNNAYITRAQMTYDILHGWWVDAGTFVSLNKANQLTVDMALDVLWQGGQRA